MELVVVHCEIADRSHDKFVVSFESVEFWSGCSADGSCCHLLFHTLDAGFELIIVEPQTMNNLKQMTKIFANMIGDLFKPLTVVVVLFTDLFDKDRELFVFVIISHGGLGK